MINKVMFVCILHCCYGWKIKTNEITKIQDLKTKCTFLCPFQVSEFFSIELSKCCHRRNRVLVFRHFVPFFDGFATLL